MYSETDFSESDFSETDFSVVSVVVSESDFSVVASVVVIIPMCTKSSFEVLGISSEQYTMNWNPTTKTINNNTITTQSIIIIMTVITVTVIKVLTLRHALVYYYFQ